MLSYKIHVYLPSKGMYSIENFESLGITYNDNSKKEYEYIGELSRNALADWFDKCLRSIRFDTYRTYLMPQLYDFFVHYDIYKVGSSGMFFKHITNAENDLFGSFIEICRVEA